MGAKSNVKAKVVFFLRVYLFLDRGEGREKEREKHQCVVASGVPLTGDLARNPGMCPDWELNQQPLGLQAGAQSTEPHQLGKAKDYIFLKKDKSSSHQLR